MSGFEKWFDGFLVRLADNDLATELEGLSLDEISEFEVRCKVTLPHSYRRFLEVLGSESGLLFKEVPLAKYAALTLELRAAGKLPTNAVVISASTAPLFLIADGAEDTPVLQDGGVAFPSVADWLDCVARECLKAQR